MRRARFQLSLAVGCAAALLTGCQGSETPATSTTSATTPTSAAPTASATAAGTPSAAESTTPWTTPHATTSNASAVGVADVSCGAVTAAKGRKLTLVAKGSAAGVADCGEATDIMIEYFRRAAAEAQGKAHNLTVQGWRCSTINSSVTQPVVASCEKQGRVIQITG